MSKFPTKEEVVAAVISGIDKARTGFLHWTNNRLYLSYAPNKMLTIHVAQEIANIKNAPEIFIDASISDILRCSLKERDKFLDYMDKHSIKEDIFSITLDERFEHKNDNDSVSKVVISIKNGIRSIKNEYKYEVLKLCKVLDTPEDEESTLEHGMLAFYTDLPKSARKKLEARITDIVKSFDEVVANFPNLKSGFYTLGIKKIDGVGEWSIGVYCIEKS